MSISSDIRNFLKATAIYGVIGGSRSLIEFFLLPLYARFLSPSEFGKLDILMLFIMIGGVAAMLELGNAVFRYYLDDVYGQARKSVVTTAFLFMIANGAAIFALFAIFSGYLSSTLFGNPSNPYLFILAGTYILVNTMVTIPINLLRVKNEPVKFTVISLIQIGTSVVGIFIFVVMMRYGVAGILMAKILSLIPITFICLYLSRKEIGLRIDTGLLLKMLKYSLPLIPASIAIWGINGLNRLFMLHYLTLDQIGIFSIAAKFVVIITLSVIAFQLAWPHFSLANMNACDSAAKFARIFNIVAGGGLWLVIGVTLFADTIIRFWLTPEYFPASMAVLPLGLGVYMYGLFYFFTTGSVFARTTGKIVPPIIAAVTVNIILNILLTPRFGFVGTAWVTAASYLVMMVAMIYSARKYEYIAFEWPRLARLILLALPFMAASGYLAETGKSNMLGIKLLIFASFTLVLIFSGLIEWPRTRNAATVSSQLNNEEIPEVRECAESIIE